MATLFLVNGTLQAAAPSAPAGATFFDNFSSGSLDTSKWIPSNWGAPGGGTFVPSNLDFSTGMLRIKVTQTYNSSGGIASVGGELQSKQILGFGTYEWVIRASSTSSTPTGSGVAVSGQISSGFVYVNNSQTEIDSPEIEGQNPGTLWWTTWTSVNTKQSTSSQAPFAPEAGFHSYKCVWTPSSISFYVDGALVSTHTGVVPQTPAYAMINHWGTNSTGWGGLATPNVTRYMFVRSFSFVPLSQSGSNPPPPPPGNPAPTVSGMSPVSGTTAGGTPVTITGTGFLAGATVSFGGTAATGVNVASSTSITATAPAHAAGAVNVVVTNTDAQTGTLNNGYTYTSSGGGGSGGGIALVQSNSGPATIQASNTTVAVSYPASQTVGDTNIVVIGWGDTTSTISSVTDSRLNTYTPAIGPTSGTGLRQSIYYAKSIAGGSNTVTVTFNKAAVYPDVRILEYSGLDTTSPFDKALAAAGTGTAANSGSVSTTAASELIFGAGTSGSKFTAAGTGFTARMINLYGNIAEDKTVNATGSYSAAATGSSGAWVMQVATFRASGGSAQPPPVPTSISPTSGTTAGGTPVTITGTGFLPGATVSFGGTSATGVSVANSTTITATTPAHAAGAVNVVVTNTDNQNGTLNNGYTYTSSGGGGGGNIAFVQSNSGPSTIQASNTTLAVTYAVAQTAGDMNIVVIGWGDTTSTISSVTDNKLNGYQLAVGPTSGTGLRQSIYYAPNIAGGSTTVTVTFSKAAVYPDVRILEYSGLDPTAPFDKAVGAAGTGTAANSGSVSTTAASELIFGAGTSGSKFTSAGSGFASRIINLYGNIAEDKTVNATGSYNATATEASGVWVMQVATFNAAP
ncbi:MAG TPA: IPT/TIG domain-containing protein [Terriglobales bacterium]|nr:IPT/TIG domain-containing protein [Terriglobales bacterium]